VKKEFRAANINQRASRAKKINQTNISPSKALSSARVVMGLINHHHHELSLSLVEKGNFLIEFPANCARFLQKPQSVVSLIRSSCWPAKHSN